MSDQQPITPANKHWRNRLCLQGPVWPRSTFKLRSETLIAIATCFAALAAAGSFWAALRQERATYDSQLYSKQVDLIGPVFADLAPFNREFFQVPMSDDLKPIPDVGRLVYQKLLDDSRARSRFIALGQHLQLQLASKTGVLAVTFPNSVSIAVNRMSFALLQMIIAVTPRPSGQEAYQTGQEEFSSWFSTYTSDNSLLDNCVTPSLQAGKPVIKPACQIIALSN